MFIVHLPSSCYVLPSYVPWPKCTFSSTDTTAGSVPGIHGSESVVWLPSLRPPPTGNISRKAERSSTTTVASRYTWRASYVEFGSQNAKVSRCLLNVCTLQRHGLLRSLHVTQQFLHCCTKPFWINHALCLLCYRMAPSGDIMTSAKFRILPLHVSESYKLLSVSVKHFAHVHVSAYFGCFVQHSDCVQEI